eukprot:12430565-Karenia_brevis.AAC.1
MEEDVDEGALQSIADAAQRNPEGLPPRRPQPGKGARHVRRVRHSAWSADYRVLFIQMQNSRALGKFPSQRFAEQREIVDVFTKRPVSSCLRPWRAKLRHARHFHPHVIFEASHGRATWRPELAQCGIGGLAQQGLPRAVTTFAQRFGLWLAIADGRRCVTVAVTAIVVWRARGAQRQAAVVARKRAQGSTPDAPAHVTFSTCGTNVKTTSDASLLVAAPATASASWHYHHGHAGCLQPVAIILKCICDSNVYER